MGEAEHNCVAFLRKDFEYSSQAQIVVAFLVNASEKYPTSPNKESRANRGQPLSSLLHARIPFLEGRPKLFVQCFGSYL